MGERNVGLVETALEGHEVRSAALVAPVGAGPNAGAEAKAANFIFM